MVVTVNEIVCVDKTVFDFVWCECETVLVNTRVAETVIPAVAESKPTIRCEMFTAHQ